MTEGRQIDDGPREHFIECAECGALIDMRDLAEVLSHKLKHDPGGAREAAQEATEMSKDELMGRPGIVISRRRPLRSIFLGSLVASKGAKHSQQLLGIPKQAARSWSECEFSHALSFADISFVFYLVIVCHVRASLLRTI